MLTKVDVFISHAWRRHEPWLQVVDLLDSINDLTWRNFSVPWHDPALHPSRPMEYELIRNTYETQIIPVDLTIVLFDLYSQKSNIRWLDLTLEYSMSYKKPIVGMYSQDLESYGFSGEFKKSFDCIVKNDIGACRKLVETYSQAATFKYL